MAKLTPEAVEFIAVHASATPPSMDIGVDDIRRWHLKRGWLDIGYHYVIRRDGTLEEGRDLSTPGAHVAGYNDKAIGICLVGGSAEGDVNTAEANYTFAQYKTLKSLLDYLKDYFPNAIIQGHRDFPGVTKACPSFNVKAFME